ncbi:lytic transglycosylase domain-containing protein [Roseicyclus persicicus]|uniref:Transglycosylase SLT domain-containing protein n=1 Tax=Roseicyclus persicicus TaxID=2650661 RepID=A0A7X6GXG6_9RHOB|nr:lytic transglycosylase domain-containing protein [Roseibacterium persicicum]NKX44196.1 transglycosylase SLT domain-containing protein [Roseibacterium persicicum]
MGMLSARLGAMFLAVTLGGGAAAQEAAAPGASPGIRRVVAPTAGQTGPRITIQITAEEHARNTTPPGPRAVSPLTPPPDDAPRAAATDTAAWFWSAISPALPADPGRFHTAQELLAAAPETAGLRVPRLATLHGIVERHGTEILMASIGTEVSPALVLAVMAVESAGRAEAVSHAGAQGLMQLIPATAERFGVDDPFDPSQNIAGGVAYLDWLLGEFGGDPLLALAGYNAGEGAVRQAGGVPPYAETRDYVPKVLATWMMARTLCRTPPERVSDGCVFTPIAVN